MTNTIEVLDIDLQTTYYMDTTSGANTTDPGLTVVDYYREAFLSTKVRIRSLDELPPNWDGEGAEPVCTQTIQKALGYISDLQDDANLISVSDDWVIEWPAPHVSATRDGGIALSWVQNDDWTIIEIIPYEEEVLLTRGHNGQMPECTYKTLPEVKSEFIPAKITPAQTNDHHGSILKWLG